MASKVDHFVTGPKRAATRIARPAAATKSRISIEVDKAVRTQLEARAAKTGKGLQTLIDEALNAYVGRPAQPAVTEALVRSIVRQELAAKPKPAPRR